MISLPSIICFKTTCQAFTLWRICCTILTLRKDTIAQSFNQSHLLNLIEHMFSVITDSSHAKSMLDKIQFNCIQPMCFLYTDSTQDAVILANMLSIIKTEKVAAPLFDFSVPEMNSVSYVQHYMADLLRQAFPYLQE